MLASGMVTGHRKLLVIRGPRARLGGKRASPGSGDRVAGYGILVIVMSSTSQSPVTAAQSGSVARPALFARLHGAARVTVISAPPGSGKTSLLRSWITAEGLAEQTAFVAVQDAEHDPQRFWIAVADALRGTAAGSTMVRELTASPELDGWAIVERLLKDLAPLAERLRLMIDDAHQVRSEEAQRQLELLLMRAPSQLRFVLTTRGDLRLGLHRLRVEGELTEIRADELRFTLDEARELFRGAGADLPDPALRVLHERTEGWAAGLRLAALSLAGHPDPERFAAEFSGSERTVAEYLLAEVLERQSEEVKRLLLRTSVLDRISGDLAERLTGGSGSERILQDLERAGAFVVSLDARRTWFRYHPLFADLLQLELRRTAPEEITGLHAAAADWYAAHGYQVEAIRHAQAALDWELAARLLSGHWFSLALDGQAATARSLLAAFPAAVVAADGELTALAAFDALGRGSLKEAERRHTLAAGMPESVPAERRANFHVTLVVLRLSLARQRGDLSAAAEESDQLSAALAQDTGEHGLGNELCALALISVGIAETWSVRIADADEHLGQGIALARRTGRPYLEILGLAHWAIVAQNQSLPSSVDRGRRAIELARRHGWADEPIAAAAFTAFSLQMLWQGRPEEAASWLERAERVVRPEADPVSALMLHYTRGLLALAQGRAKEALSAFRPAERLAKLVVPNHALSAKIRAFLLHVWTRLGDTQRAEQAWAQMHSREREAGEARVALAALRLAEGDPRAATVALAPILDGTVHLMDPRAWMAQPLLLQAIACDALGDLATAGHALERALDLAEPDGAVLPFLLHPTPRLLARHAGPGTAHPALISRILSLLEGSDPESVANIRREPLLPHEALSAGEMRVLRYLPTNLSAREIADELSLSVHTVRTHMRHTYEKLGAHNRTDAVNGARARGLLAPTSRGA
jgi:LuxR family transcriptional regulator, maltose regulon positive regulatory protein